MREDVGDLWTYPADARCVPTNGVVNANGELVMGAGVAKEAARRWPSLPAYWGNLVRKHGNSPFFVLTEYSTLVSFPTKYHWRDSSDPELIMASAWALAGMAGGLWHTVVLPRVGCGLGGLTWERVRPLLTNILDDRFVALTPGEGKT